MEPTTPGADEDQQRLRPDISFPLRHEQLGVDVTVVDVFAPSSANAGQGARLQLLAQRELVKERKYKQALGVEFMPRTAARRI